MDTKPKRKRMTPKAPSGGLQKVEFPGYPLYPASEDAMNRNQRVDANLESPDDPLADTRITKDHILPAVAENNNQENEDSLAEPLSEFDVTPEDLIALGPKDLSMDGGDDEQLENRTAPVDFAADDLDIPGSELDDAAEDVGSEDEENNSYSLGGDDHGDLEESKP